MKDRVSIKRFMAFILCAAMLVMYMPSPRMAFADETAGAEAAVVVDNSASSAEEVSEPEPEPAPKPAAEPEKPAEPKEEPAAPKEEPKASEPAAESSKPAGEDVSAGDSEGNEDPDAEEPSEDGDDNPDEVSDDADTENQGDALDGEAVDGEIVDGEIVDGEVVEDPEEEEYPAFKKSKTVDGVTITLEADKGVLPKGADFKAHRVNRDDVFAAVDERLETEGKELVDAVAFDITPVDKDGNEIHQPKGSVKVTFSGTGLEAGDGGVDVFRVSDNAASVTEMGASVATESEQEFSTNHFSIYVASSTATHPEGDGQAQNKRYVLEFGEWVTLNSTNTNYWDEDWEVTSGTSYISSFDSTVRRVTNNNTTSSDGEVTVRHRYRRMFQSWNSEYFYITCKPQVLTVQFMLKNAGDSDFSQYGEIAEVFTNGSVDPPQMDPTDAEGNPFYGWCTEPTCENDAVFTNITKSMVVYGKYAPENSIRYRKNTTDPATVPDEQKGGIGNKVKLGDATRNGYVLSSWTTNADGTGDSYQPGDPVTIEEGGMTLYAQWSADEMVMRYHYNYPGSPGGGIFKSVSNVPKNSQTTLISDAPTRSPIMGIHFVFRGWATSSRADDPQYYPGETYYTDSSSRVDLYAVWGTLSLNDLTKLTAKSDEVTYNGEEHSVSGVTGGTPWSRDPDYVKVGDTAVFGFDIYAYIGDIKASGTNAGHYSTPLSAPLYYLTLGNMVRLFDDPYAEVECGTLTIKQAEIKVTTDTDEKVYDGTELTAGGKVTLPDGTESTFKHEGEAVALYKDDTLNMRTVGSQTEVGKSDNPFELDWGKPDDWGTEASTAYKYNYTISEENVIGTLTVYYGINFDDNADGDTVEDMPDPVKVTEAGEKTLPSNTPKREHYSFLGWAKEKTSETPDYEAGGTITITEDDLNSPGITLYAVWSIDKHKITFVNEGQTISEKEYAYGTPANKIEIPDDPTKPATAQYTYTFAGWDKEIADVTEAATYTATYTETVNKYTVKFVDEDGSTISEAKYDYGTAASDITKPANPTKAADSQYTYTFDKWTPEIAEVTKDATYTATYTRTPIPAPTPAPTPTPAATTDDGDDDGDGDGGGAAAAAAVAPAAPADAADDIADEPTPTTTPDETTIDDEPTPTSLTWAVANLVMAVVTALGAVIALFRKKEDEDDEDDSADKKMLAAKIAGALAGVAAPITFFLTENMADVAVAFDKWTPLMAGILAVQVVSAVLNKTASKAADAAEEAAE